MVDPLEYKVKKNFSIPLYLHRLLKKIKSKTGIDMSVIVTKAIKQYLQRYGKLIENEEWDLLFEKIIKD